MNDASIHAASDTTHNALPLATASRHFEARLDFFAFGPDAMQAMGAPEQRIARSGLAKSLIELIRLRVSQINGCAYCIDKHASAARSLGIDERRLMLLPVWCDTLLFTDSERAALAWAEALTRVADSQVPDETWEHAKRWFLPSQLVDLTLVVTTTNAWNRFAVGFRKRPL
ncbi:carboxymuconolactone decarboxylase family protein [Lysobacter yangpyeongensis]|uniref:Carboxymuconolactone decarboxylase family protein n=1 Tax=Lysobacter yangpyeongensis TaxID=346182 RepID=A0ABW0SI71_9GAMM